MNKAIILHTVDDADDCVSRGLYRDHLVIVTHSSVEVYLRELHGIRSRCITEYLSINDMKRHKDRVSVIVEDVLSKLDERLSGAINKSLGTGQRWFVPLYSYLGKYHFLGYLAFVDALDKAIAMEKIAHITFYDMVFNEVYNFSRDMKNFCGNFFAGIGKSVIASDKKNRPLKNALSMAGALIKKTERGMLHPVQSYRILRSMVERFADKGALLGDRSTIFLCEPLYNIQFMEKALTASYNVVSYADVVLNEEKFRGVSVEDRLLVEPAELRIGNGMENAMIDMFIEDLLGHMTGCLSGYAQTISSLRDIDSRYPISMGIWGTSPVCGKWSVIFEWLRSKNIRIIGAQHGSTYGETYKEWHFDSDFDNCDHYFSYGFTAEDLQRMYPHRELKAEILPFGMVEKIRPASDRKKIDILFPVTNSMSVFNGGTSRIPPHELTKRQIDLLEYLNSVKGADIYIKLFYNANYRTSSVLPVLKRLKNLKIVNDMSLIDFLGRYDPRGVLIEYPATPLYEIVSMDTEIFLLNDNIQIYEACALEKIRKRVHYSESTERTISEIGLFLNGSLEPKRNDSFYKHYVHKDGTEANMMRFIEGCLAAAGKSEPAQRH